MLNVFLKQASPMLVRGSIVVLLISILLASWFISHRETDKPSQKTEKERLEKEDILPELTRIDPIEVTDISIVINRTYFPWYCYQTKNTEFNPYLSLAGLYYMATICFIVLETYYFHIPL